MARSRMHEDGDTAPAVTSFASVSQHPLHPMLVPLPIGAFTFMLLADIAFVWTGDPFWARAAIWLTGTGVLTGLVAGMAGMLDFTSIPHARNRDGWFHAIGNSGALLLALLSWLLRFGDPAGAIVPWGLLLSLIIMGGLLVTAWFGGELCYRYRVGVIPRGTPDPYLATEERDQEARIGRGAPAE